MSEEMFSKKYPYYNKKITKFCFLSDNSYKSMSKNARALV